MNAIRFDINRTKRIQRLKRESFNRERSSTFRFLCNSNLLDFYYYYYQKL